MAHGPDRRRRAFGGGPVPARVRDERPGPERGSGRRLHLALTRLGVVGAWQSERFGTTAQVARAVSSPPFTTRAQAAFRAATSTRARAGSSSIPASTGSTDSGRSLGPRSRFVSPPAGEDRG